MKREHIESPSILLNRLLDIEKNRIAHQSAIRTILENVEFGISRGNMDFLTAHVLPQAKRMINEMN